MKVEPITQAIPVDPAWSVHALDVDREASIEAFRSRVYSREDTWVQELLSNARDAIRERRDHEPEHVGRVWIHFDHDQETTTISDDGLGMSRDVLERVFRVLGVSTRRHRDDMTGAWGLGSKSPLKVCDAFTICTRSRADRRAYTLLVGRLQIKGAAAWSYAVQREEPAEGGWGTTVTVPTRPDIFESCVNRALHTVRFWSVPVDLVQTRNGLTETRTISGQNPRPQSFLLHVDAPDYEAWLARQDGARRIRANPHQVLLDDIPYDVGGDPLPSSSFFDDEREYAIRIRLKRPSAVDLTTGREFLDHTPKTRQLLQDARQRLRAVAAARFCLHASQFRFFEQAMPDAVAQAQTAHSLHNYLARYDEEEAPLHPLALMRPVRGYGGLVVTPGSPAAAFERDALKRRCTVSLFRLFLGRPVYYGTRVDRRRLTTALGQAHKNPRAGPEGSFVFFVHVTPGDPAVATLTACGARPLNRVHAAAQFRLSLHHGRGQYRDYTDPSQVPTDVEYVMLDRLSQVEAFPQRGVAYLVRPARGRVRTLRDHGRVVSSLDAFKARTLNRRFVTSRGRLTLRSILKEEFVWVKMAPAWLLKEIDHPPLIVRADDDDLRLLALHVPDLWRNDLPLLERRHDGLRLRTGEPVHAFLQRWKPVVPLLLEKMEGSPFSWNGWAQSCTTQEADQQRLVNQWLDSLRPPPSPPPGSMQPPSPTSPPAPTAGTLSARMHNLAPEAQAA